MRKNKLKLFFTLIIILGIIGFVYLKARQTKSNQEEVKEVAPVIGSIKRIISCTASVLPKNRLEIKPPVGGRIEQILVKEGDSVKIGQILAVMSSTERAALIDAARGQGEEKLKYWQDTYKPILLPSPIDGEVIVATTQPGQTMTTADAVVVLSDKLIIRSQVDETDIGKITNNMEALVILDAYPDTKIKAKVEHIYYESQTVNNVTIYQVDLLPEEVPSFFRSGMNTTVDFITENKENILIIPLNVVYKEKTEDYVLLKPANSKEPVKARVKLGISDDRFVEVISGVSRNDIILEKSKKYSLPKNSTTGTNPFMPARRR